MLTKEILECAYPVIERLATSRSRSGGFAYYESDDVYQEIWGMCLDAMDRYDVDMGPVENFLVVHVTNRLKNLKRDKYFRPGDDITTSGLARNRMDLVNALPLGCNDEMVENCSVWCSASRGTDPVEYVLCNETIEYISDRLPEQLKDAFESIINNNNKIRKGTLDEIRHRVTDILIDKERDVRSQSQKIVT